MDNADKKKAGRRRFLTRLAWTVGAAAGVYADARYLEPGWLQVSRHTVYLPDLPLPLDGMAIVQLSDLHYGPVTPAQTIRDAIALAVREKPHLVVLTGDFVNRETHEAESLAALLAPLQTVPLGVVACLGNHDCRDKDGITKALETRAGVVMLRNASRELAPGLVIAGIEDTLRGNPDPGATFQDVPAGAACVYLTHNPVGIFHATARPCLALSGHTHGGQVRIPGYAPRRPAGMDGFPLMEGWGTFDRAQLYINRGIGMMHQSYRFRCRPEVSVFTLKRGAGLAQTERDLAGRVAGFVERVGLDLVHRLR